MPAVWVVSYETIRSWCATFGPDYAAQLRRRRPRPGDKWHFDEVFVKINGTTHYLWRAVDQHGNVLDILVQSRRNAVAAKRFFRKLLKGLRYVPRVIVTDKLASYQVAHRELLPSVTHRRSKYLNNRAENSHQPTRVRERVMKRFASPGPCPLNEADGPCELGTGCSSRPVCRRSAREKRRASSCRDCSTDCSAGRARRGWRSTDTAAD